MEDLHELASQGSSGFVILAVVVPSTLGVGARALLGARRVERVLPHLKLLNLINLLVLNYSNAAAALPQVIHAPDWDFLALTMSIAALMCAGAFALGWFSAPHFQADRADQTSLTYGLGMNNNGTGLVLASSALADLPTREPRVRLGEASRLRAPSGSRSSLEVAASRCPVVPLGRAVRQPTPGPCGSGTRSSSAIRRCTRSCCTIGSSRIGSNFRGG